MYMNFFIVLQYASISQWKVESCEKWKLHGNYETFYPPYEHLRLSIVFGVQHTLFI